MAFAARIGRCCLPIQARRRGIYRYYVAQRVLTHEATCGDDMLHRISAAQIEGAVIGQVRGSLARDFGRGGRAA
jgi:hypothetical protein